MTLATDLRGVAAQIRGIPGELGMRPHRVYLLTGTWTGDFTGEGTEVRAGRELTENGQPPQVKWLNDQAIALGGFAAGSVEVGNLTPAHSSGGVDFSEVIGSALTAGQTLFVRIVGPRHPDGCRYRIKEARHKSAVSYSLICEPQI